MENEGAIRIIEEKLVQLQSWKSQKEAYLERVNLGLDTIPAAPLASEDELLAQFFRGWKKASIAQRRRFLTLFIRGMLWKNDVLTIVAEIFWKVGDCLKEA